MSIVPPGQAEHKGTAPHTAGPWHAVYGATAPAIVTNEVQEVASVCLRGPDEPDGTYSAETKANALLIAAAPTMAAYIRRRAADGDAEAQAIVETFDASR